MNLKSIANLELNKILASAAEYANLDRGRELILSRTPTSNIDEVRNRLALTREADKLLFQLGVGKIEQFDSIDEELDRAKKGSVLSCGELLQAGRLLRAADAAYSSISKVDDEGIILLKSAVNEIYFDKNLEEDIFDKIISDDAIRDDASDKLFAIRSKIKQLNERIKSKLSEYVSGKNAEYLQDAIVTIRNDRYVIPVKAEHKSHIKGFIHDRSKTGATFFIEPEYVLELNNELIALTLDEREEVEAILRALSVRVGNIADSLKKDGEILAEIDSLFAMAEYCYSRKCTEPTINGNGYINIIKGRHPLIDKNTVVPVSIELGDKYNFLLLSGANTGGKTVTLKMCGLFCLMAECGLFIPAAQGSNISVYDDVFCDIGDSQSIEENLSTFSSHMENVIEICRSVNKNSLVLIDELGGGTNPDEGQALAKAIVKKLLEVGCKGIVTTHFTPLKEFAYSVEGIENASMEFDSSTLRPLYSIKIGLPGASNALAIARRIGMDEDILRDAMSYLSEGARNFENVIRRAEDSRVEAEAKLAEAEEIKRKWQKKTDEVNALTAELNREKEKITRNARSESRRIISERTERAEELLSEIEEIFNKQNLTESDLIKARTLKNKLKDSAFEEDGDKKQISQFGQATADNIKENVRVFVVPMETFGRVISFNKSKNEAEIQCGSLKMHLKLADIQIVDEETKPAQKIKIIKNIPKDSPLLEINVLGLTVSEALYEVDNFIDKAVTDNLDQIKIIHGVGTGKLKNAIREHLKKHKNVESFRSGKYGEGENGVTFIKLK